MGLIASGNMGDNFSGFVQSNHHFFRIQLSICCQWDKSTFDYITYELYCRSPATENGTVRHAVFTSRLVTPPPRRR